MRVAGALVDRSGAVLRRHLLVVLRALESGQVLLAALASVVRYPGSKLEPLLQGLAALSLLKRLHHSMVMWNERQEQLRLEALEYDGRDPTEDRVRCEVLHEPGGDPAEVRVDVVFIHGLNGSIRKTWTQGERSVEDGVQRQLLKTYRGEEDGDEGRRRRAPALDLTISNHHFTVSCKRRGEAGAPDRGMLVCDCDDCAGSGCSTPLTDGADGGGPPAAPRPKSKCWPRDWLPVDCPGVRVLAIDYTTDPYLWRPVWVPKLSRRTMQSRSQEMTKKLLEQGVGCRPIVWAAHSKGGLFVKQILVDASENCSELVKNTQGILFYSVPHHGSKLARINIPWLLGQSVEITEVKKDCPEVRDLHRRFLSLYENDHLHAEVVSLVESQETPLYFTYVRVVDEESADPGVGEFYSVSANHKDICKPTGRKCVLYLELAHLINRVT